MVSYYIVHERSGNLERYENRTILICVSATPMRWILCIYRAQYGPYLRTDD